MAKVVLEMTGDVAKLLGSLNRVAEKLGSVEKRATRSGRAGQQAGDKIKGGMDRAKTASQGAGRSVRNAFGANALGSLKSFAAQFVGISAAVALATKAIREMNQERKRGAELAKVKAGPISQLAQLAGGKKEQFNKLLDQVKATRLQTGASAGEAAQLQFTLESLGLGKERKFFAQFRGIANEQALAGGAGTLQAAFGAAAGSPRAITNKLLAASAVSKTTLGEFAPATTIAAKSAQAVGGRDTELLALVAELSKSARSAEVGSTQVRALIKTIETKGLGGKGILAVIPEIQRQTAGLTGKELQKYFGRIEGLVGFRSIVSQMGAIRATERQIEAAGAATGRGDLSSRTQALIETNPQLAAVRRADISGQREQIAQETLAVKQLGRQAAVNSVVADAIGESGFNRFLKRTAAKTVGFLGGTEEDILTAGAVFGEGESTADIQAASLTGDESGRGASNVAAGLAMQNSAVALKIAATRIGGGPTRAPAAGTPGAQ